MTKNQDIMQMIGKALMVAMFILGALNGVVFLGSIVSLLHGYVGFFAYFLWIFVFPIFSPAFLFLPWFDAWVENSSSINENILWLWLSFFIVFGLRALFWKWAPDR